MEFRGYLESRRWSRSEENQKIEKKSKSVVTREKDRQKVLKYKCYFFKEGKIIENTTLFCSKVRFVSSKMDEMAGK
jgi:hypothetical protein